MNELFLPQVRGDLCTSMDLRKSQIWYSKGLVTTFTQLKVKKNQIVITHPTLVLFEKEQDHRSKSFAGY